MAVEGLHLLVLSPPADGCSIFLGTHVSLNKAQRTLSTFTKSGVTHILQTNALAASSVVSLTSVELPTDQLPTETDLTSQQFLAHRDYKNPSLVWGVDRKIRSEGYCLVSRGILSGITRLAEWCQTVISRDRYFYLPL